VPEVRTSNPHISRTPRQGRQTLNHTFSVPVVRRDSTPVRAVVRVKPESCECLLRFGRVEPHINLDPLGPRLENSAEKYSPFPALHLPGRKWPGKVLTKPPRWLSTDLRDGNQALVQVLTAAPSRPCQWGHPVS
jgi:hypothetical protein